MPRTQYKRIGVMSMTRFEQSEKRKPEIVKNFQAYLILEGAGL